MAWLRRPVAALAAFSYAANLASALPSEQRADNWLFQGHNISDPFTEYTPVITARQDAEDKVELRILPLGASIMSGAGSSDGSG
ncbi:hypothetical protein IMZ48_44195 [Candidatus Bathyarchaeota archaeon]|nr:hypothetical protein [Candidatus Bathyarchaeota archaeon]